MKELGRLLAESIRDVDRAVHGSDEVAERFAVVMPETGVEGALVFTDRLRNKLVEYLQTKGADLEPGDIVSQSVTYPEHGEPEIHRLRADFASADPVIGSAPSQDEEV